MSDISSMKNLEKKIALANKNLKIYRPSVEMVQQNISSIPIPQVMPKIENPFDNKEWQKSMNKIRESGIQKSKIELENNESLKAIVECNQQIAGYNKNLVSLNEKILNKINSLDDTLSFLNDTFKDKNKFDKRKSIEQTALLLELRTIIEEKDTHKLFKFMSDVGAPLGVGLLTEYLKIKLALS